MKRDTWMTHHRRLLRSTVVLGVLVGAGLLTWSTAGHDRDASIPPRPQMAAIHLSVDRPAAEPLPRIEVLELPPQAAPEPRRTGTSVDIPPRPRLAPAAFIVPEYTEDLPSITVPDLRQPPAPLAPTLTA